MEWSRTEQNWLFSASFWGGVTTVIPSILISHRLSPRIVFAVSIAMKVCEFRIPFDKSLQANALLPILARTSFSFYGVFGARFVLGLAEPFIYPAINTIIGNWFPMEERSTAVALFTTGNQLAMFIGNPIAAWLCHSKLGWPAVYYMTGSNSHSVVNCEFQQSWGSFGWLCGCLSLITDPPKPNGCCGERESIS